jgi:cytolysin (calcineurin-like family phosphatase)
LFVKEGYHSFLPNATNSKEDMMMGNFFDTYGVMTADCRDEKGAARFADDEADAMFHWNGRRSPMRLKYLNRSFGITYIPGINGCSRQMISFHLKRRRDDDLVRLLHRYHVLTHGMCK